MRSRLNKFRLIRFFRGAVPRRISTTTREWIFLGKEIDPLVRAVLAEEDPWEAYKRVGSVSSAISREMLDLPNGGALYACWAEFQDIFETGKTPVPEAHAALRRASELWLRRPEALSKSFLRDWLSFARKEAGFFFDRDGDWWHEPASGATESTSSTPAPLPAGEKLNGVMHFQQELRIEMIVFDNAVALRFGSGGELKIEQPFEVTIVDEPGLTITPGVLTRADQVLQALLWRTVVSLTIHETGSLVFTTADGCVVEVSPGPDYETWTFHDGAGLQAVSVAGGGVAIWGGS